MIHSYMLLKVQGDKLHMFIDNNNIETFFLINVFILTKNELPNFLDWPSCSVTGLACQCRCSSTPLN